MRLVLLAALLVATAPLHAQRADDRTIDEVVDAALGAAITPGAVLAVIVRDSTAFVRAYGAVALEAGAPALTGNELFHAGALGEVLNALAAVRLAEDGVLNLDAPLGTLIPELPRTLRDITMHQLLTHTAGLSHQVAVPGRGGADDLGAAARGLTPLDRFAPGGTYYSFSEPGIRLTGLAIERAAGMPYAEAMRRLVLEPLEMHRSTFDFRAARTDLTAGWHESTSVEARVQPARFTPDTAMAIPQRGFHTTISDAARLVAALLNDGVVAGERLLPEGLAASLLQPHADIPFSTTRSGRGVRITLWNGRRSISASGGSRGHGVAMQLLPAERIGVVLLSNKSGGGTGGVPDFVFRRLIGDVPAPPRAEPTPPDSASLQRLAAAAGRYLNGAELIEIVEQNGLPIMKSGELMLPIRPLEDHAFAALLDNRVALTFRMLTDDTGRTYLWLDSRALGREVPR